MLWLTKWETKFKWTPNGRGESRKTWLAPATWLLIRAADQGDAFRHETAGSELVTVKFLYLQYGLLLNLLQAYFPDALFLAQTRLFLAHSHLPWGLSQIAMIFAGAHPIICPYTLCQATFQWGSKLTSHCVALAVSSMPHYNVLVCVLDSLMCFP